MPAERISLATVNIRVPNNWVMSSPEDAPRLSRRPGFVFIRAALRVRQIYAESLRGKASRSGVAADHLCAARFVVCSGVAVWADETVKVSDLGVETGADVVDIVSHSGGVAVVDR